MIRIKLSILAVFFMVMQVYAQKIMLGATPVYQKKALSLDEVNILSSFYHQEGIHSGVTGGIGTEKLSDYANVINVKLSRYNDKGKKFIYGGEIGVDYYTSASSDKIDTRISSASSSDVRVYPSLNFKVEDLKKKTGIGGNLAFSKEYDYMSIGGGLNFSKTSKDENTEFNVRGNAFFDTYTQFVPSEFRTQLNNNPRGEGKGNIGNAPRNSFDLSMSLSRVMTKRFQMSLTFDLAYQKGMLSTPFHRVYFEDNSLKRELLPGSRFKIPMSVRANYFVGEKVIIRSFYRYYQDDWGIKSHTLQLELPVKISSLISVSPMYRYYRQAGAKYFAPYKSHQETDEFFTSDYDLSGFHSNYYGVNIRCTPFKTFHNLFSLSELGIRAGKYDRSDGLSSGIVALHVQFRGI